MSAAGDLVRFPGGSLFVRETGSGRPLLLVNGLGAHTQMWEPLERALPGFRIVEFDLPGAGQSPAPRRAPSMPDLARLAVQVMDRYGLEQPDVLGYSMGGMVAQQLAADSPSRIRRLVLVATTPGVGAVQADPKALLNILTPVRYSSPKLYRRTIGSLVGGRARRDPDWVMRQTELRFARRPTWRGYLGQMQSMSGWSALPLLPRVQSPTLVISGGDDPLSPVPNGMLITYQLPHARLLVLPDEGHLLVMDETGAAHAAIREFLEAAEPEQARPWLQGRTVSAPELAAALRAVRRQVPPLSILDARARRRYLDLRGAGSSVRLGA